MNTLPIGKSNILLNVDTSSNAVTITLPAASPGKTFIFKKIIDDVKVSCNHEFIQYIGFNDSFQYCKHCDEKKR